MIALLLALAAAAAYANSLSGPFIFDDHRAIVDNATIRELWPLTHALAPPRQTPVAGRPIANLSFAVNYAFGGLNVWGYHAGNLIIHILAALALLGLLRWTAARMPVVSANPASIDVFAGLCALAWVLHPLNTEAVDYLTQRTESLAGFFFLFTLYASTRALSSPGWPWLAAATAANFCGVATKESVITAGILVVLWDRVFVFDSLRSAFAKRRALYGSLACGWLVFGLLSLDTPFFSPTGFETHVSRWTYLMNQAPMILRYLRLSVWPHQLVLDYGIPRPLTLFDVWPAAAAVVALMALTVLGLARAPKLGAWGAWFFLTLAPASSLVPIPTEVGAERRMYLPLVAVVVLVIYAVWRLVLTLEGATRGSGHRHRGLWRTVRTTLAGATLVSLGVATARRNAEYRDGVTIWQTVLDRWPHARAHANIAPELRDRGRVDEAIAHLRLAAPDDSEAQHALGSALLERGDVQEGVSQLEDFVQTRPQDPHIVSAREELAQALYREERFLDAIVQLEAVVRAAPGYTLGHLNLANVLLSSGDFDRAIAEYRECLRLQPDNPFALTHVGLALSATGRSEEAIAPLRQALMLDPRDVTANRALINALINARHFVDAEREARRFVSSFPADATAQTLLGVALAAQGHVEEATAAFSDAVRLDPQSRDAQDGLARLRDERRLRGTAQRDR